MTRAVQWYMGFGVCEQQFVSYRSRSEVNPAVAVHGHFRYYRLRLITRDQLVADPQTHILLDAPRHGLSSGIWF